MKISLISKIFLPFLVLSFLIFELLSFLVFGERFLVFFINSNYLSLLIIINLLVVVIFGLAFLIFNVFDIKNIYKTILPILLNLGTGSFIFFSPNFAISQFIIFFSILFSIVIFLNFNVPRRYVFVNLISFFIVFLFYFSFYSALSFSVFPYWLILIVAIIFSNLLLYYKLKSIDLENKYIQLFIVIFDIIIIETFIYLFFIPLKTIFIKSLLLVFIYYIYWSMLDMYVRGKLKRKFIISNFFTFFILLALVFIYLFFRGK
jgi:hypothetical protein